MKHPAQVRADFILKLHREGQRLPRRQEAESAYVDCRTALVTHEEARDVPFAVIFLLEDRSGPKSPSTFCHPSEVEVWADGKAPDGTKVVSLSHCWEAREHCDPYGYQLSKLGKALTGKEWVFIDYVSLHQFQRLSQQQNLSFRRAMQNMHVLYCHDATSTLRIESLTPEADIAEAERNQASVTLYHHPTGLVKPVPVTELVKNRTKYGELSGLLHGPEQTPAAAERMALAVIAEHTRVTGARGYVFSDNDAAIRRLRRAAAGSLVGPLAFFWKWVAAGLGPLLPFWIPSHGKRLAWRAPGGLSSAVVRRLNAAADAACTRQLKTQLGSWEAAQAAVRDARSWSSRALTRLYQVSEPYADRLRTVYGAFRSQHCA